MMEAERASCSPTLETLLMNENFAREHSGEFGENTALEKSAAQGQASDLLRGVRLLVAVE